MLMMYFCLVLFQRYPAWWLSDKESACNVGDSGSILGWGRCPGEGNGTPLQYSCLENPMDRGAWWAAVPRVEKESEVAEWLDNNHHHHLWLRGERQMFWKLWWNWRWTEITPAREHFGGILQSHFPPLSSVDSVLLKWANKQLLRAQLILLTSAEYAWFCS